MASEQNTRLTRTNEGGSRTRIPQWTLGQEERGWLRYVRPSAAGTTPNGAPLMMGIRLGSKRPRNKAGG